MEPITLAADIWSLGVLAYVLLTGFSPFGGDSDQGCQHIKKLFLNFQLLSLLLFACVLFKLHTDTLCNELVFSKILNHSLLNLFLCKSDISICILTFYNDIVLINSKLVPLEDVATFNQETLRNIASAPLDFPAELFEGVSDEAKDFIRQCLHRAPP